MFIATMFNKHFYSRRNDLFVIECISFHHYGVLAFVGFSLL